MATEAYKKPIPTITPEMAPFYEGARRGELVIQHCRGCGAYRFPPRELCSHCLSGDSDWLPVSGRGEVFTFNVMHQVYHPGFAGETPYAVVLIKLAEGPKLTSNLLDTAPADIRVGMPVRVTFEKISDEITLPKFVPA